MIKIIFQKFKEYLATRKRELQPVKIRAKKIKRRTRLQFWIDLFDSISVWAAEKKTENKEKLYLEEDFDYTNDWFRKEFDEPPRSIGKLIDIQEDGEATTFKVQLTDDGVEQINKMMDLSSIGGFALTFNEVKECITDETLDYIHKETDIAVLKSLHEETNNPELKQTISNRIKEVVNEKKNKRRAQRPKRRSSVLLQPAKSAL